MITRIKNILVIDDEKEFARTISRHLKREGFTVDIAFDAESAMEKIQAIATNGTAPFDLVITDVIMPGINGVELLKWLHDNYPQTAVLVISGMDLPQESKRELHPICDYFRKKPFTPDVIMDAIQRIEIKKHINDVVAV